MNLFDVVKGVGKNTAPAEPPAILAELTAGNCQQAFGALIVWVCL